MGELYTPPKKVIPWRLKNPSVNVEDISQTLYDYLSDLPSDIQKELVITAGKEEGHSKTGGHGKGNAVDIRYNEKLLQHLSKDKNRLSSGIAVLNPEHGTAPHIHLSYGIKNEISNDYYFGKKGISSTTEQTQLETPSTEYSSQQNFLPQQVDNSQMLAEFNKLLELSQAETEKANKDAELVKAKNTLAEKQADFNKKMEFVRDFKLQHEFVDYSAQPQQNPQEQQTEFEDGGEFKPKPIYVNSKSDPRYKSYNDSMSLYRRGLEPFVNFNSYGDVPTYDASFYTNPSKHSVEDWGKTHVKKTDIVSEIKKIKDDLLGEDFTPIRKNLNNRLSLLQKSLKTGIFPTNMIYPETYTGALIYKKPVQQVLYEKPQEVVTDTLPVTVVPKVVLQPKEQTPFSINEFNDSMSYVPPVKTYTPSASIVNNKSNNFTPQVKITNADGTIQLVTPAQYDVWAKSNKHTKHF